MVCAGKGSGSHKATMVEDTVGEPFQDTAGTSLHVLMKLLSPITLALAPLYLARQMIMETVSQVDRRDATARSSAVDRVPGHS
jgi:Inorganic H+ pyrophosphatase